MSLSNMPQEGRKRSADGADATSEEPKRFKATVDKAVVDEFTCPITNELPLEPVTAEDGRIYEKSAIEKYFGREGENRRSPVTNEPIGPKLMPALQVRNMLENLVNDGLIEGDKAAQWKKRIKDKEFVASTRAEAANGDAVAMDRMGSYYEFGRRGVKKDYSEAFKWYEKAAETGHFSAMASLAMMYINGNGTEENVAEGLVLLGAAAQGNSSFAAHHLGEAYAEGSLGLVKNSKRARFWLERVKADGEVSKQVLDETKDLLEGLETS